jgi:hypothetical protein
MASIGALFAVAFWWTAVQADSDSKASLPDLLMQAVKHGDRASFKALTTPRAVYSRQVYDATSTKPLELGDLRSFTEKCRQTNPGHAIFGQPSFWSTQWQCTSPRSLVFKIEGGRVAAVDDMMATDTDRVSISYVSEDPAAPSGFLATAVKVSGTTESGARDYFLPFMRLGQAKPHVGQTCQIRWTWFAGNFDWLLANGETMRSGRQVETFSCETKHT